MRERIILRIGQKINLFGHKMQISDIKKGINNNRAVLTCAGHCCTSPMHIKLEAPTDEIAKWIKNNEMLAALAREGEIIKSCVEKLRECKPQPQFLLCSECKRQ